MYIYKIYMKPKESMCTFVIRNLICHYERMAEMEMELDLSKVKRFFLGEKTDVFTLGTM